MKVKIIGIIVCLSLVIVTIGSASETMNSNKNKLEKHSIAGNENPQILWWYDLNAPSFGSAAVNDIDGDGSLEIVFGTYFNDEHIYALNAESGTLLWKYNTGGCNDASPAIADVDLDGDLEVVVPASSPYRVYCFDGATGQVEWSTSTGYPNCIDSPPAVADVDNDGKPEIILGTFYGYVFCLNGEDGSICWQTNLGSNSYIQSGPNILDLDGDGQLDIVVAQWSGDYRIYALKGDDASILWFSDQPQDHMYHGGAFADIDEDGKPEIAIGCYDNHVYIINGEDGSLEWDYTAPFYIGGPTSIADLNNDGHFEIVFTSHNRLGALSYTGSLLWSYTTGGSIFRGGAIADIDADRILDVVFGSADGILRVLQGNDGSEVWTYDLEAHYGQTYEMDHAPVIADFDNDGKLDVFIIGGYGTSSPPTNNHGRAYALAAGEGTGLGWPMFRYDLRHSACFSDNQPPNAPMITGTTIGKAGMTYKYSTNTTDPNEDQVFYNFSWGDGDVSDWLGPYNSSEIITASHMWIEEGNYEIRVKAKDIHDAESNWSEPLNVTMEYVPLDPPTITGPTNGKVGVSYDYTFVATDPNGDQLEYFIEWGDGNIEDWFGPFGSGDPQTVSHAWSEEGTYRVRAKVKDDYDMESDWGTLDVTMPRSRAINTPFQWFLQQHPNLFPILQKILLLR
jgi:outer membrane protein assembly factor BamB